MPEHRLATTRAAGPPSPAGAERLHTVEQAADLLNTTERFVRRLIAERRIAFHRVGRHVRIAEADLIAFIRDGRVEIATLDRLPPRRAV